MTTAQQRINAKKKHIENLKFKKEVKSVKHSVEFLRMWKKIQRDEGISQKKASKIALMYLLQDRANKGDISWKVLLRHQAKL